MIIHLYQGIRAYYLYYKYYFYFHWNIPKLLHTYTVQIEKTILSSIGGMRDITGYGFITISESKAAQTKLFAAQISTNERDHCEPIWTIWRGWLTAS